MNVDDGKIEAQNPIDMRNQRITNIANPTFGQKDCLSYKFCSDTFLKSGFSGDIDCNGKHLYNVGSYTNDDQ